MVPSELGKLARCACHLISWIKVEARSRSRIFLRGRGGGWYIRLADSMGDAHQTLQLENWDLIENVFTRSTGDVTS